MSSSIANYKHGSRSPSPENFAINCWLLCAPLVKDALVHKIFLQVNVTASEDSTTLKMSRLESKVVSLDRIILMQFLLFFSYVTDTWEETLILTKSSFFTFFDLRKLFKYLKFYWICPILFLSFLTFLILDFFLPWSTTCTI